MRNIPSAVLPALAVAVAAAISLVLPAAASAGTYTVYLCKTPEGAAAPLSDWRVNKGPFVSIDHDRDNCPQEPYELELDPVKAHPSNDYVTATLQAPAGTEIQEYRFVRSVQLASSYGYRYRELTPFGDSDLDPCYAPTCTSRGSATNPLDPSNLWEAKGRVGVTGLQFALSCALPESSAESCPASAPGARFKLYGGELVLVDTASPVIAAPPSGPLVSPRAPLAGWQPVSLVATDTGGGVYQAAFEVDGVVTQSVTIDDNGGRCRPPFTSVQPCKSSASGTAWLDTSQFTDGEHSLRILVSDATGTNVTAWGPITIHTDNARCNPRPTTDQVQMSVKLAGRRGKKAHAITTRFGRSLLVRGRLLRQGKDPIRGAKVCVAERSAAGVDSLHPAGQVVTNAHGAFSFRLPPGTSRRVYFTYRTPTGAAVDSVAIRVRAPVSLHGHPLSLRNGQTLTMEGELLSPPFPKRGALVELQAYRETGWQTFGTTNTNRRGRFLFRYTFSRTTGVQHYLLRARIPKQTDYPFESGASHPIKVTVAG